MNSIYTYFICLVLPVCEVVIAFVVGRYFIKRSKTTGSYTQWSIGVCLIVTALLSIIGLIVLFYEYNHTYSWGKFVILYAPFLPVNFVAIGTVLIFSGLTLWGYFNKGFVQRGSLTGNIRKYRVWLAGGVLTGVLGWSVILLMPSIHLLPYRGFAYEGRVDGDTQILKVEAYRYFSTNPEYIFTVRNHPWQKYHAAMNLQLDWRGRVELRIQRTKPPHAWEIKTYYLPFERSTFRVENGVLVDNK